MKNKQINSLLLDAIEEYGVDKLTEVLKTLETQKTKESAKIADAVDLYKQILLFVTTYYPNHMSEEVANEIARYVDKNPKAALEVIEAALDIDGLEVAKVSAKEKPEVVTVSTNINGEKNTYQINLDKYIDTINKFFDKYGI